MILTLQSSKSSLTKTLRPTTMVSMSKSLFVLIAYLTCCIGAWPAAPEYRRNYNDYQPMEAAEPELQQYNYNQWDLAQEPLNYDQSDDYFQAPISDVEALSNLFEMYENPPVWGQIINQKPESELEQLKAEERRREAEERQKLAAERQRQQQQYENDYKYYAYDRQEKRGNLIPRNVQQKPAASSPSAHQPAVVPAAAVTATPVVSKTTSISATATTKSSHISPNVQVKGQSGQKEVPLLRPPTMAKTMNIHEPNEPVITVAQRSPAAEKPSAYDTLRKYLTLEDALKKEAEKRRAPGSRVHKRTPSLGNKQIVSDVDSLRGQLNSLKKSAV